VRIRTSARGREGPCHQIVCRRASGLARRRLDCSEEHTTHWNCSPVRGPARAKVNGSTLERVPGSYESPKRPLWLAWQRAETVADTYNPKP